MTQAESLLFAARRLLRAARGLSRRARRRRAAARAAASSIAKRRFTEVPIGLVAPSRDAAHFTLLARERLGACALPEPVRALALDAGDIVPLAGEPLALFADGAPLPATGRSSSSACARGSARTAVHGLAVAAEHRPEHASRGKRDRAPATAGADSIAGLRPFWLLPAPQPLEEIDAAPHHGGPLKLLAGPERIESGWWDGGDVARDYFVAADAPTRALVWVYRERRRRAAGSCTGCLRECSPPTPSCTASPTSPSCAAPRTRRSWSRARRARLRGARDHRRVLARRRGARAPRGEGARAQAHRRHRAAASPTAPQLVLLATNRAGYGNLSELITTGAAQRHEGQLSPDARRPRRRAGRLPRAAGPSPLAPVPRRSATGSPSAFPAAPGSRRSCICGPTTAPGSTRLRELARAAGLPLVAAGDVHMHVRSRRPPAGRAHRDPPRHAGRASAATRSIPNAERHLRAADAARAALSARAARRDAARRRALRLLARRAALRVSRGARARRRDAGELAARSSPRRASRWRFPRRRARQRRASSSSTSSRSSPSSRYEPYFLTVYDIVRFARARGILCQGRGSAANSAVCYASASPRSIRRACRCCSSASSRASATSRPTSTSTSSTSGARR